MITRLDKMFEKDFIRLPRPFIRMFNLNTALLLAELYSEYIYWKERNLLEKGGWFYSTVENMAYMSGLTKHQQLTAYKELEAYGIIKIKHYGLPRKRYFKFNMENLNKLYNDFNENLGKQKEVLELDDSSKTNTVDNIITFGKKLDMDDSGATGDSIMDEQTRMFSGFSF